MGTMVRINEDNYEAIKKLAKYDGRSTTNMANRLLDKALGRDTSGEPNVVLPNTSVAIPQSTGISGAQYDSYEKKSPSLRLDASKGTAVATAIPDVSDLLADPKKALIAERQNAGEANCCLNEMRPCKHWVWDTNTGEGYRNSLSGRLMEVD